MTLILFRFIPIYSLIPISFQVIPIPNKKNYHQESSQATKMSKNTTIGNPPKTPLDPMEFLSRSWSLSSLQVSKALAPPPNSLLSNTCTIPEDIDGESTANIPKEPATSSYPFSFASWETSTQFIVDRIMSQSQEVSSARSSHSSGGPLPVSSLPEISLSEFDSATSNIGGGKTAGRRQNTQLHAAVSVAGVAAAVAAIAAATSSASGPTKGPEWARTDTAVASAATLVAAQCVEAAESLGADHDYLASVVSSAVNARSADYIMTLTNAATAALRGAASLKARALKEVSTIGGGGSRGEVSIGSHSDELVLEENFLGICNRKLLARGCELLKRTRKGDLHWKVVSVYINRMNQVTLKMKSKHVAGTLTKKKKYVVLEVVKAMPAWAGRYLLEGGENRRYFGLKTADRGLIEFECRNKREYQTWTDGVSRLISLAADRSNVYRM